MILTKKKPIPTSEEIKRDLILRGYQHEGSDYGFEHALAILALCPGAGKTEIAIDIIRRYLIFKPNAKILILPHSTTVLKDNFTDRLDGLNFPFTYSTDLSQDVQIHICLPNSEHLIKNKYDFLIVDEAHENYLAERVQRIIKKTGVTKQLLLTGTPSKFIKKGGYNIYTLATNQIPEQYFAKLQIELVASNYNWLKNLNKELEVKEKYRFTKTQTKKTLEAIILKLIDRVKKGLTAEEFNNPGIVAKLKTWAYTYRKLGKTMIVCKSVKQADDVYKILIDNGVNAMVSDYKTDPYNNEIANFKKNKYDVLIVVDRARLGYSDDSLYNIIDMSGTHNPNMIYQIFSRTLRGTPDMKKYYLKVTSQEYGMLDYAKACVCAALMLTDHKYLSTFNGDNFKGILIPVLKKSKNGGSSSGGSGGNVKKPIRRFVYPEFTHDVIDMFRDVIHNLADPVCIYKLVTLDEVRSGLTGRVKWTEAKMFASALGLVEGTDEYEEFIDNYDKTEK
jgi:superfamily II DNA or RNA helicase